MAARKKRSYDSHATRERILDIASEGFQRHGYHATSMHDVMRDAGVPGGSMYHYFPSKKSLGLAVINERVARSVRETWIEQVASAPNAQRAVLGVFADVARGLEQRGEVIGCPITNLAVELALLDRDFQEALNGVYAAWGDAVRDRLMLGKRSAAQRKEAAALATLVVATFAGAMTLAKTAQSAAPLRDCARLLAPLL